MHSLSGELDSSDYIYFIRSDKASTSNMKIDTLSFLGCILTQHDPAVFYDHIHLIVPVSKLCVYSFMMCVIFFTNQHFS